MDSERWTRTDMQLGPRLSLTSNPPARCTPCNPEDLGTQFMSPGAKNVLYTLYKILST